jgi:soluble lytic murein transglycosylase
VSVRRIGVACLCLALGWPVARAHAEAASVLLPEDRGSSTERFDPDVVKPPRSSVRKAVLEARASGDHALARSRALAGLPRANKDEAPLLRWLAAQSSRELGEIAAAYELLLPLAESDHPLTYWAKLSLAECAESKDPVFALALLDGLLAPSRDVQGFPGRPPAERARARVLEKLGRREDAIAALERLASEARDDSAAIQVLVPLSELLAQGDEGERVRAISLARRISLRAPATRAGKRAEELAHGLLKTLPDALRDELTQSRVEDKLVRADALLAGLRYNEAVAAYAELEEVAGDDPDLACKARYGRAKALLDRRSRAEGSVLMAEVASHCAHDGDRRAWARYHAGRAFSALGQNEQAIAQFEALEQEAPTHSLADDALYRAAKVAHDMGDIPGVIARLSVLPERYPQGDMQQRARFSLAWEAHARGDLQSALRTLGDDLRDEHAEDLQGRAAYYRARWLGEAGDLAASIDGYALAFETAPLAFYGQLAYSRLHALAPERAGELSSKLSRARGGRITFAERPEFSSAGFRRVLALLSVGEVALATWELRVLGFTAESADVDLALLAVTLLDRAGAPESAVDLARRHMARLMRVFPDVQRVPLYELVYPMAYAPLIESTAKREGVPAAFLRAVAREESGFRPDAVSRAHAYGLVQLLLPTARGLVKSKKERVRDASALLRPELNLTLGARFMANLAAGLRGTYALVPPAYNAGPGAVARWLRERPQQQFDEWVEEIPYDETRGYTRRVLQTYGVYHWLATGELLSLPLDLAR